MLLLKGSIRNRSHKQQHEALGLIHSRSHNGSYYKAKYGLSLCSSDGLDFEFKQCLERISSRKQEVSHL
jgi:hypothetical protein